MCDVVLLETKGQLGGGQRCLVRLYRQLSSDDRVRLAVLAHRKLPVAYPELAGPDFVPLASPFRDVQLLRHARVVVANTPLACLVGVLVARSVPQHSRPTVVHLVHSVPRGRLRTWVVRSASRRAAVRSCVSYSLAKEWVQPLRVDLLGVGPLEVREEPSAVSAIPNLFAMGRPARVKGLDLYVGMLVGTGRPEGVGDVLLGLTEANSAYARNLAASAPDWMTVRTGLGPSSLRAGDILVLPSRAETAALLAQEAMGRGAIVVATPVGDVRVLIDDGVTGFVAAEVSEAAISGALRRALDLDDVGRLRIAANAVKASKAREGAWELAITELIQECLTTGSSVQDVE